MRHFRDGHLHLPETEDLSTVAPQRRESPLNLEVGTRLHPGIRRKHLPNEDNLIALQETRVCGANVQPVGLFAVADGMGGYANGQEASRLALEQIRKVITPTVLKMTELHDENALALLLQGVQQANQAVYQSSQEHQAAMGTTLTAVLVVASTAYVANVGDSRTYLYRQGKGLWQITHDHSVVAALVEANVISADDIYTHPERNVLSRALGERVPVEVDTFLMHLQAGDSLLLCSDGLWEMVRDPDIARMMSRYGADPARASEVLLQAALSGGGKDNVSVIVVSVRSL